MEREEYNKYMRENHLNRYYRLRKKAIEYLGGKCVECGSVEKLEIDHIERAEKELDCSKLLSVSEKTFWNELNKCQLLCKSCHNKKTTEELGKKIAKGTHGTLSSYRYCHCSLCKEVKRNYQRQWRIKRKCSGS